MFQRSVRRATSGSIVGVLLVLGFLVSRTPASAKHGVLQADPDEPPAPPASAKHGVLQADPDEPPAPSNVATTTSGPQTVIEGEFVESHDLLSSDEGSSEVSVPDIVWSHKFVATLSGRNHVTEQWNNVRIGVGGGGMNRHRTGGLKAKVVTTEGQSSALIGSNSSTAVWHVLGPNKLQRLFAGQHFLMKIEIEIGDDHTCRMETKYLEQQGFTAVVMRQATTGLMANFSLPKVQSAACAIR